MPEYEQTGTIMAEPDVLFDYLAEVEHLPEYLTVITEAEPAGPDLAVVTADIHGAEQHAEGWLRVDGLERRMEWGIREGPYHGWLEVEPDDLSGGSVVTIHVSQDHASDADDDLIEALDNIRQLVQSGEI
jgi:Polyketide cyclase / dehydrase and lipid transport